MRLFTTVLFGESMKALFVLSCAVLILAFLGLSGYNKRESKNRILEWGPNYYSIKPDAVPREFVDIIALEELWKSTFTKEAPSWDGSGRVKLHCIVHFDGIDYSVSLPQYPPSQKETMRFFDVFIRDPNSYSTDNDIMLTLMFDQKLQLISVAMNANQFKVPYTKQIFVTGESPGASLVVAREISKQARQLIKNDDNSYWGKVPNFIERFIVALCNHVKNE